jgi:alpha-tubulin suppressor-like RCC1 family protein
LAPDHGSRATAEVAICRQALSLIDGRRVVTDTAGMRLLSGLMMLLFVAGCNLVFREGPAIDAAAVDAPPLFGWANVSAGIEHTCAIDTKGGLWCWGSNRFGQLALPLPTSHALATKVNNETWTMVSNRGVHTCALQRDKTLWCWGDNSRGQLGVGPIANQVTPQRVTERLFTFVATSRVNTCAIDDSQRLYCWGENESGQLGDPNQGKFANMPVAVDDNARWLTVAVGDSHTCGLKIDQTLWCWGNNALGQLNGVAGVVVNTPQKFFADADWVSVTTFAATTCGVKPTGVACWGQNLNGEIGNGLASAIAPRSVGAGGRPDWSTIVLGGEHTCGLQRDTLAWFCWGNNGYGQLGQFSQLIQVRSPQQMATDSANVSRRWLSMALGAKHTCAIDDSHQLFCMGSDNEGQLGTTLPVRGPRKVGDSWTAVSATASTACGFTSAGLHCWGNGRTFQHGNDVSASQQVPLKVTLPDAVEPTVVAAGNRATCAVIPSGAAKGTYCWGAATNSEFGNAGFPTGSRTPVFVSSVIYDTILMTQHVCATSAGTSYCWGANNRGQATQAVSANPQPTPQLVSDINIAVGGTHTCGFNGNWRCWGDNVSGQLGGGISSDTLTSISLTNVVGQIRAVYAGGLHTCAITNNSAAYCWGRNLIGEVGDGTNVKRTTPVAVLGGLAWRQLALGALHTCGITSENKLYCWGDNSSGELGLAAPRNVFEPMQVGTDADWDSIDAGDFFTCARKKDSSLWCWGYNVEGQLGIGTGWRATMEAVPLPK